MNVIERIETFLGPERGREHLASLAEASYSTVRHWERIGRIPDSRQAVTVHRELQRRGLRISLDEIVGLGVMNGSGTAPRGRRPHAPSSRSYPSSATSDHTTPPVRSQLQHAA